MTGLEKAALPARGLGRASRLEAEWLLMLGVGTLETGMVAGTM